MCIVQKAVQIAKIIHYLGRERIIRILELELVFTEKRNY